MADPKERRPVTDQGGTGLWTERLRMRPWRVDDAAFHRALWLERDVRVPARRRIDAAGRPTLEELRETLRRVEPPDRLGLWVVEHRDVPAPIGYAGLVDSDIEPGEPMIAYEFLREHWGKGYATEAGRAVLTWADELGYTRVWSSAWDWNIGSLRVLEKLGFSTTDRVGDRSEHGRTIIMVRST